MRRAPLLAAALGAVALAVACSSTETKTELVPPTEPASLAPVPPPVDAGEPPVDAGPDAAVCPPAQVNPAAFIPYRSARAKSGMCVSQAMLEGSVDACVKGFSSCNAWLDDIQNLDCVECLVTMNTDAAWGPVVLVGTKRQFYNLGGAAELGGASLPCAKAVHALEACVFEACTCKPTSSACDKAARAGACRLVAAARDTACVAAPDKAIVGAIDKDAYAYFGAFCPP